MEARKLIDTMMLEEKLKDTMRHCYTKNGRRESVAEHCWMASLREVREELRKDTVKIIEENK